jgi:hypothetical protein
MMKIRTNKTLLMFFGWITTFCVSELAFAQVVILPSQQSFSYSGVISVPDSGSASLGGSGYLRSGGVGAGWGPYGPRTSGSSMSTSSTSVSVQIIDLKAMEESMNAANNPKINVTTKTATADPNVKAVAGQPARQLKTTSIKKPTDSENDVLKPKARNRTISAADPLMMKRFLSDRVVQSNPERSFEDVRYYFGLGQDADALRRFESAGVYYRMAFDAMTPSMRQRYEQFVLDHAQEDEKNKDASDANKKYRRSF